MIGFLFATELSLYFPEKTKKVCRLYAKGFRQLFALLANSIFQTLNHFAMWSILGRVQQEPLKIPILTHLVGLLTQTTRACKYDEISLP